MCSVESALSTSATIARDEFSRIEAMTFAGGVRNKFARLAAFGESFQSVGRTRFFRADRGVGGAGSWGVSVERGHGDEEPFFFAGNTGRSGDAEGRILGGPGEL
jgi:hypothetical protein